MIDCLFEHQGTVLGSSPQLGILAPPKSNEYQIRYFISDFIRRVTEVDLYSALRPALPNTSL